jgi:hypothetical protein
MNFATKLAQTRTYTTTNQNGVDSQEVYNEAILQAVETTNPTSNPQEVFTFRYDSNVTFDAGAFYSMSLSFSSDFMGNLQGVAIEPNTIINLSAKGTLKSINVEVLTGSFLWVAISN